MPRIDAVVTCDVLDSFRVQQVAGLFDVTLEEKMREQFTVDLPDESEDWQIGLIVGPSGSGKSTVARHAYGELLRERFDWPAGAAVVDCFGEMPIKSITGLLSSVGFSSPPSWVKPFAVLSNGEQFRCNLARALSQGYHEPGCLVVVDEFTSVVDRNVAQIGSAAVAKSIRQGHVKCRFIAVTCHYDVAEWLEPDWTLDMASGQLERRRLRRPEIELRIQRCDPSAWRLFARHHYLSSKIPVSECYVGTWRGNPVSFIAVAGCFGHKGVKRIARVVTLPDYQGVGIGGRFLDGVADYVKRSGFRTTITASHPSVIGHCKKSPLWRTTTVAKSGHSSGNSDRRKGVKRSTGRAVVSFEFTGD